MFVIFSMQKLQDEILQIGVRIGDLENALDIYNNEKAEIEQDISRLQGFELLVHIIYFFF
jgi:hypothetical protein